MSSSEISPERRGASRSSVVRLLLPRSVSEKLLLSIACVPSVFQVWKLKCTAGAGALDFDRAGKVHLRVNVLSGTITAMQTPVSDQDPCRSTKDTRETHAINVTKQGASSRVELKFDGSVALSVDRGPLKRIDVQGVAAAAGGTEEAFERARELVSGREVDEAVFGLRM